MNYIFFDYDHEHVEVAAEEAEPGREREGGSWREGRMGRGGGGFEAGPGGVLHGDTPMSHSAQGRGAPAPRRWPSLLGRSSDLPLGRSNPTLPVLPSGDVLRVEE